MTRAVTLDELSASCGVSPWRLEEIILEEVERGNVEKVGGDAYRLTALFVAEFGPAFSTIEDVA